MSIQQEITATIASIKKSPMDLNLRLSLIQLYILDINWSSALKTTQGYLKLNPTDEQSKTLFLSNIECEIQRHKVFSNIAQAMPYPECSNEIIKFQQSLLHDYFNNTAEQVLADKFTKFIDSLAYELTIKIKVSKNNTIYQGLWLDTDMRTACVLELFCQGQYYWLPFADIKRIIFKDNEILTDVIWRRANIELMNGQITAGFVPARYAALENVELSDEIKYSKLTQWQEINGLTIALGQKVLSNGEEDVSLLDIQEFVNLNS